MKTTGRRLLFALVAAAALGGGASADDCGSIATLRQDVVAAADAVSAVKATFAAHENLDAPSASAADAFTFADLELGALRAGGGVLVLIGDRLAARFDAAKRAIDRARTHAGKRRVVRAALASAAKSTARALRMLDRAAQCGSSVGGKVSALQVFPSDNWWNTPVDGLDVAADSDAVIDFIGRGKPLHADFGTSFGIPYVVLDAAQPLTRLTFDYDDESDHGAPGGPLGYPIPVAAKTTAGFIEGGVPGGGPDGDRHLLLVDPAGKLLFEIYAAQWTGNAWKAGSGAIFDVASNARRPEGWTSADAAGLAIFPGLVRAEEAIDVGEIRHALRFTVRATQGYVYPASHDATHGSGGASRPPLGLRVRLKAGVDLSPMSAPARVVLSAMKKYGLILADNGSDWFVSGAPDARWDDERMHDDFAKVTGNDFEVVK